VSECIHIGPFTLKWLEDELFIYLNDGEGGAFDEVKLAEAIKKFYEENF